MTELLDQAREAVEFTQLAEGRHCAWCDAAMHYAEGSGWYCPEALQQKVSHPATDLEDRLVPADHRGGYPPGLSGYTHGNCRCWACKRANRRARARQRAGKVGRPHLRLEDRVRQEMSA